MWIFTGASLMCSACMSVLTATNSTWLMPASIILLTAFSPAPPTPTTLITARYEPVSPRGTRWRRAGCSGSGSMYRVTGGTARICGAGWGTGAGSGTGSGAGGDGIGSGRGDGGAGAGAGGCSTRAASSQLGTWSTVRSSGSVARKSSASGPSRMLARRRAIQYLLGQVAIHARSLTGRVVLQHRLPLDRSLGKTDGLADPRVEDEIPEVLLQDIDSLARVEKPLVEHRREDPLDLHL